MVRDQYFAFDGGWNETQPPTTAAPGSLRASLNYECGVHGGYRRIDGYERYSGFSTEVSQAREWSVWLAAGATLVPGVGEYVALRGTVFEVVARPTTTLDGLMRLQLVRVEFTAGPTTPEQVTMARDDATPLLFVPPAPAWDVGHSAGVAGPFAVFGQLATRTVGHLEHIVTPEVRYTSLAARTLRGRISEVPGMGPVRGVFVLDDQVYAFRDDAFGERALYRAQGGVWSAAGIAAPPGRAGGGRFGFVRDNVAGTFARPTVDDSPRRMYGVDGMNRAFEFDGLTLRELDIGHTLVDAFGERAHPTHVIEYKRHLFLAYPGGNIRFSDLGDPDGWTVADGGGFLQVEDEVTGFAVLPNDALLVLCRHRTYILYGTPNVDAVLRTQSDRMGALAHTAQRLGSAVFADDRGLMRLESVDGYENFADATLTQNVADYWRAKKGQVIASVLVRDKNQYRIFFDDGDALYVTFDDRRVRGIARVKFPDVVHCTSNDERSDGSEIICFGSDAGHVYRMDAGRSFDGAEIESYLRPAFHNLRSPERRKRIRRVVFDVRAESGGSIAFQPQFSYGSREGAQAPTETGHVVPTGGSFRHDTDGWDELSWNDGEFEGEEVQRLAFKVDGSGVNFGCLLYGKSADEAPHTLYGATVHYTPRRLAR